MLGADFWTFLSDFSRMWDSFVGFTNQVMVLIVDTPLLSICIGIMLLGFAIKVFGELL